MNRSVRVATLWFLALKIGGAQVTTATLFGIVEDPSGAVVAGVEVRLHHSQTGAAFRQTASATGEFTFDFLPVGAYRIVIQMQGFKSLEIPSVELGAAQRVRRTFTLELGATTETVSVSAAAPLINASSAEQRESLSKTEVNELPVSRRNVANIVGIGTGIQQDTEGGRQFSTSFPGTFILNGLGKGGAAVTMDGVPASGHPEISSATVEGGFIGVVSMDAVEEVQVSKGVFSAEYGRALAGNVNVITKSGTNTLHGSLFELFNVENLNARNTLLATKPGLVFNQYGGSLGGPVRKDKIFLFGAYESYAQRAAAVVQSDVPSPLLRSQMLAAVPAYKLILDRYPLPNQPLRTPDALSGRYLNSAIGSSDTRHFVIKPDVWLWKGGRLSGAYVKEDPRQVIPSAFLDPGRIFRSDLDRFTFNLTAFSTSWTAETRVGWNRPDRFRVDGLFNFEAGDKPESIFGGRRVTAIDINQVGIAGYKGEYNAFYNAPSMSVEQKFSINLGKHSLKIGGMYFRQRGGRANVETPILAYATVAQVLANTPSLGTFTLGQPPFKARAFNIAGFVQDDWRITRKLVLNLGLRYEYFSSMTATSADGKGPPHMFNAPLNFDNFQLGAARFGDRPPTESNPFNFGPRLSFAYDMDGKTVIRGGAGIMFNALLAGVYGLNAIADPKVPFRTSFNQGELAAFGIRYPIFNEEVVDKVRGGNATPSYQLLDTKLKAPYAINYTLGLQRALRPSVVLETAFVANRGVGLIFDRRYNEGDRLTGVRPNPSVGDNLYYDNAESTNYLSWQSSLRQRYSNNLVGNLHYTWSKTMNYGSGDLTSLTNRSYIQNFYDIRANKGRAFQDLGHILVADLVYRVPEIRNRGAVLGRLLGGWQLSGVGRVRSGYPITVEQISSRDRSRPDVIDFDNALLADGRQWLNPAAFRRVPVVARTGMPERAGNAGRSAFSGPGAWRADIAIGRRLQLWERLALDFRCDLLNSLNHDNPITPVTNLASPVFGRLTGTEGPREIQFHMRLSF